MTENEALKRMKMCIGVSPSENIISSFKLMSDALDELQQYRTIGTIDEFKALKEKSVAKKPIKYDKYYYKCPACNEDLGVDDDSLYVYGDIPPKNCSHCGQKLDWQ